MNSFSLIVAIRCSRQGRQNKTKGRHLPKTMERPDTVAREDRGNSNSNIGEAERGLRRDKRNKGMSQFIGLFWNSLCLIALYGIRNSWLHLMNLGQL